ncbi:MAG TPA: hypothetical protein VM779_12715 [Thermoanaerobaculia bacterium]|nr:hypothetical protein [Thermoanaerobaculia bacterium]
MAEALTFDDLLRFHREVLMPEFAAVRNDLSSEITAVRNDLGSEIAAVRNDLHGEMAAAQSGLHEEIVTTRNDFARHLTSQTDSVRVEIRSFRREFDTFRRDVLTHFDRIYHRLESDAFEFPALKAAFARFERPDND